MDFWVRIYTQVDTNSGLIHDARNLSVVYEKLSFAPGTSQAQREKHVNRVKGDYERALRRLAADSQALPTATQRKALQAWPPGTNAATLRRASESVRFQLGQSDRFKEGLVRSGLWRAHIRQVLKEEGLPQELEVLPHVESSFNPEAYSKMAAAGLWQFMPTTARQFMRVDHIVDERMDPYAATVAAARLLKTNHIITGTWPLALTAYNHGAGGIRRAAQAMGTTDIARIVKGYEGTGFGFASRNFYVSFLAALEVDRNAERYFGPVVLAKPEELEKLAVPDFMPAPTVASAMGTSMEALRQYNPSLLKPVWSGEKYIPKGYILRFPKNRLTAPLRQLVAGIPASRRFAYQQPDVLHRIARGETLSQIASRYHTSVRELMAINGLRDSHRIRAGVELKLPGRPAPTTLASAGDNGREGTYVIQPGDSLWGIARRFNLTEKQLVTWNDLKNKNRIMPGDLLRVAGP